MPLVFPGMSAAATPLVITSADHARFSVGRSDAFTFTATRSLSPELTAAGALPDGVEFTDNGDGTATLSGTPRTEGTYPLTINAEDPTGRTTEQRFLLAVGEGWYNASWTRRKPITISRTMVSGTVTNFPVTIRRSSDSDLAARAQADADDILFTDSDGVTKLNHQIQSYTSATGVLWAWVQVPSLTDTADHTLYMYYGNASATSQQNATAVWDSNHKSVWHLSEAVSATAGNFKDSTSNANHASYQGSTGMTTDAEGGVVLDGVNDYLSTTTQQTNPQVFTIEAWVKTSTASGKPIFNFESTQTGTAATLFDRNLNIGTDGKAYFALWDGTAGHVASGGTNLATGVWHFLVATYDTTGDAMNLYVDGNLVGTSTSTQAETNNGWWRLGSYHVSDNTAGVDGYFPGTISEPRVSNVVRNANWVTTNFRTQNNPWAYTTFGTEQSLSAPAITSATSTSFADGAAGTFTITTTGGPTPVITKTGTLPAGVTFVDNGDGTATLSGTTTSVGAYPLTITASNGVAPNATQNFTLNVVPSWYNASWLYRKAITIDHTKVPANTTTFAVLISRTDSDLAAHAQSDADDILFTDTDMITKLPHEIESYTSASGILVAWVQVPSLSSTVDKTIYMYYGNASAANQQNVSGTWRSEYKGVWHLSQSPTATAPQFKDSTSNANHGTNQGSMPAGSQVAGKINGSITLDGSNDYISTAVQQTNPQSFTIEVWVKTTSLLGKPIVNFEDIQTGSTATNNYDRVIYIGTDGKPRFVLWDGNADTAVGPTSIADNQWHYLVATYTGTTMNFYVDGVAVTPVTSNNAQVYNGYWRFGSYHVAPYTASADGYFAGSIDEVRVSTGAWSATAITARYNNQSSPSTFVSVAGEVAYSVAPTITSANSTSFGATLPSTFTITTTGAPTPTISMTGTLPSGVSFVDNGNGTATLSGTPVSTSIGTYPLSFTAANGVSPNATQSFTLTVVQGWYNSSWRYRKAITIDRTKVGATLTNFPFLVSRTDSDLAADAQSDGDDILFTSSDGTTKLNHQIESFTSGTGVLVSWVNVPTVSNTTDTIIYMYYGNASAANQQNATAVWDSGYDAVWHLSEGPTSTAPQFQDSTSNTNHGTAQGPMAAGAQVSGKVDGSLTLDGTDDNVTTTNLLTNPQNFMESVWFRTTSTAGKKVLGFEQVQSGTGSGSYDRHIYVGTDSKVYFGVNDGAGNNITVNTAGTYTDGNWHQAVGYRDDTNDIIGLYVDGTLQATSVSTQAQPYNGYVRMGSYRSLGPNWPSAGGHGYFAGSIDEVRWGSTVRSSSYVSTQYNNQSSPSTFFATGSEVVYTAAPAITSANSTTFTAGSAGTFTVTTTGVPTPAISKTGTLPTGVTFVDNGDGTATLSGTPTLAGTYPLTITASSSTTPNATQSFTLTVAGGSLTISLPGTANLGSGLIGNTVSGALGSTQVIDNRGVASASWTASVSSTTFTSGGRTVPLANLKYWSGPSTSTTGSGTFTPGQSNSGAAQDMTTSRTGFTQAGSNGINQATWNPTFMATVPITVIPGSYSGTVTHSVV
ncbi:hypothetical protein Lesp02_23440 [Lentzea sp. NBRC 105346]|uniref:DUF2341 domain-containing protein n=1 Tax=Lentzea sp. NBRC 105346 TaxID=3032205 RepID=UPI0024A0EC73|nr:DUF2341 domain-containing protein [Lentzea sp. NBRC 105346]GLZ30154.1 hypothetical protein Lesp02_23440 [Lentzea sp. NBRC 105346]